MCVCEYKMRITWFSNYIKFNNNNNHNCVTFTIQNSIIFEHKLMNANLTLSLTNK